MKIDKSRFLLLTTSLAATTTALVVAASGCSATNTATTDGGASNTVDSGASSSGSTNTDSGTNNTDSGTTVDSGQDAAPACLGNTAAAPNCGPAPDGQDAAAYARCSAGCTSVSAVFKTEVAANISQCLDIAPTCEGVDPACVAAAVAKACADPTATTYCTTTVAACPDQGALTQGDCVIVASALNDQGRTSFTNCIAEGGATACHDCVASAKAGTLP